MDVTDKAEEKKILEQIIVASEEFLQSSNVELNYQKITDTILNISGAKYAVFSLYDEDGSKFRTVAFSAPEGIIKKASSLIGFKLIGKEWEQDPVIRERVKSTTIIRFSTLSELVRDLFAKPVISLLEKTFNIGELVYVKILKENVMIGHFTLIMHGNVKFKNDNYVELYSRQVGLMITRKKATEALQESEEIFKRFMEYSPIYVFFKDENIRALRLSKNYETMLGKPVAELLGKRMVDLFPYELAKNMVEVDMRIMKEGKVITVEEELNGRFYSTIKFPIFIEGKPRYLAGYTIDITERKKAEEALQKSENLLSKIFDILPVGLWIADKNGKLVRSNRKGREIWGAEPLVGQDQYGVFKARRLPSGEEIAPDDWALAHSINSGETILDEILEIDAFDGKKKIILNYTSPVLDEDGKVEAGVIVNLDITEQKIIQDALVESEGNLQRAQRLAKIGSWSWIAATDTVQWSKELCQINGHDPKLPAPSFAEMSSFFTPESWERLNEAVTKALNNGKSYELDLDLIRTDGTVIKTIAHGEVHYDTSGKISGLHGTVQDITERKKIEEMLLVKDQAIQSSINAISIADLEENLIYVNPSFLKLWGYIDEKEVLGKSIVEFWSEKEKANEARVAIQNHGTWFGEVKSKKKDGSMFFAQVSGNFILSSEGKPLYIMSSIIDITERKKAEESLHESEEKYRTLFDTSAEGILIAEIETYKFKYANTAICRMLGYTEKELKAMNIADIHRKEDLQGVFTAFQNQVHGNYSLATDIPCLRKDNTVFYADINTTNIIIDGLKCTAGFFHDTTDRKKVGQEILYLSFHDYLTGLYNRRFFEEELNRLDTKRQLPLSFIMGDINNLKLINDVFGHTEGDRLLKETADILKKVSRSDDILARWGGDEFVILLPKTSSIDSEEIVARIKRECKKTKSQKIPLSLSLGTATKEAAVQGIQAIIIDAESNMYRNKLAQKESISSSIIFALSQTLYEKSNETKEHTDRVCELAIKLGKSIKLPSHQLDEISLLASLHDLGKVAVSETILAKEGKLTKQEWEVIKRHPEIGFNIAQSSPQIAHIAKPILSCHENWDGSGYPMGLAGKSIPVISRIILIADAYDVMTSGRIYKEAMSSDDAIKELKRCAGSQFDPDLINKFIEIVSN